MESAHKGYKGQLGDTGLVGDDGVIGCKGCRGSLRKFAFSVNMSENDGHIKFEDTGNPNW